MTPLRSLSTFLVLAFVGCTEPESQFNNPAETKSALPAPLAKRAARGDEMRCADAGSHTGHEWRHDGWHGGSHVH